MQHVLNANLLAVSDTPYRVELQAFNDGTLKYEYSSCSTAADEVSTLRVKVGNGECKYTMMMAIQQSDAIGSDECCPILITSVEDALLESRPGFRLLAESGRDDDECPDAFLGTEVVDVVGAILGCYHEDGEIGLRDVLHVVKGFQSLDGILFGVDDTELALIVSAYQIAHDGATGLVDVVGAANDDDALRLK